MNLNLAIGRFSSVHLIN